MFTLWRAVFLLADLSGRDNNPASIHEPFDRAGSASIPRRTAPGKIVARSSSRRSDGVAARPGKGLGAESQLLSAARRALRLPRFLPRAGFLLARLLPRVPGLPLQVRSQQSAATSRAGPDCAWPSSCSSTPRGFRWRRSASRGVIFDIAAALGVRTALDASAAIL